LDRTRQRCRIGLHVGIQIHRSRGTASWQEPISLTIDVLSGGRVNLSVGVGHADAEFAALGVPFTKRRRITDYCGAYADAGVTRTTIRRPREIGSVAEYLDYLEWFSAEVIGQVDETTVRRGR
jgi:hypothetical protein